MQRPPGRRSPPVLFTRPANEWVNKVNQRHKEFAEITFSPEQKESLDRWAEAEFARATLELDGVKPPPDSHESSPVVTNLLSAVRAAVVVARAEARAAGLPPVLLTRCHEDWGDAKGFRKPRGDRSRALKPVPAEHV